jgi:tetratricopeptide (TPR) repeat protein
MALLSLWSAGLFAAAFFAAVPLPAADTTAEVSFARRLLSSGRIEDAEKLIRKSLIQHTDAAAQAELYPVLGDALFQRADFESAGIAYRAAVERNPRGARAWWGLGRIELTQFRRKNARDLFSRAFGLDPRDPEIILSYLEFAGDAASRSTLLRNVVQLTRQTDIPRAEQSQGQLALEDRLKGLQPGRMTSPYQAYTIRLSTFQPVGPKTDGVLVPISIDGGRTLRLLLDSGARGITIAARSAKNLHLEPILESSIGGLGTSGSMEASLTIAKTVAIGQLHFENCVVEVTRESLTNGADGVIGMNLFEAFRIKLDARNKTLELTPFEDQLPALETTKAGLSPWSGYDRPAPRTNTSTAVPVYGFRHFLLVRTKANGHEGLFLVDTGSAVTSLAREFAPPVLSIASTPLLHGAGGDVSDARRISPVTLEIAGRKFVDSEPVSMDLGHISQRQGVRISGILGYSALSRVPVTFNYRDGLVDLGDQR